MVTSADVWQFQYLDDLVLSCQRIITVQSLNRFGSTFQTWKFISRWRSSAFGQHGECIKGIPPQIMFPRPSNRLIAMGHDDMEFTGKFGQCCDGW